MVLLAFCGYGQAPNWSVNANAYQFSMTFTLFLSQDNQRLDSNQDQVAAFVGSELRGVSSLTYVSSADKYVAYLTVYANTIGETVSFKFYNSQTDVIVTAPQTISFEIDGNKGSLFQSFSVAQPRLSQTAILSGFGLKEIEISSLSITSDQVQLAVPFGTDVSQLVPEFTTEDQASVFVNYQKQTSGQEVVDFTQPVIYQVLSADETVLQNYEVTVTVLSNTALNNVFVSTTTQQSPQNPFELTIQFDQPVTSIPKEAYETENLVVYNWAKTDDLNHSLNVMLIDSNEKGTFKIKSGTIMDNTNNYNQASNLLEFTLDDQAPFLESMSAGEMQYTLTFSEPVQGITSSDFELKGLAASAYSIKALEPVDAKTYQLHLEANEEKNGEVFPVLKTDHQITDVQGNALLYSLPDWVQVDHTAPTILSKESFQIDVSVLDSYTLTVAEIDEGSSDRFGLGSQFLSQSIFTKEDVGEHTISYEVSDVLGNVATKDIKLTVIDTTLSNQNPNLKDKIRLYPNPVSDGLHIKMQQIAQIKKVLLYAVSGKHIKTIEVDATEVWVKCTDLEAGIYFVEVQTQLGNLIEKIVKL